MNLSIATLILLLFITIAASATHEIENARRFLEDQSAVEDDYSFLAYYSLKMISCRSEFPAVMQSETEFRIEYSTILFRLCPSTGECNDDAGRGCSAGYGDYTIGINTFVKAYLEHKGNEIQQLADDNFQIEDLAKCRQYKADQNSDYPNALVYIGPTCTVDGTGVRLALFIDKKCETLVNGVLTFEEVSAGRALPYSDGGLVSQSCEPCTSSVNDDDEEKDEGAGVNEMCLGLYQNTEDQCEVKMAIVTGHSNNDDIGCYIIHSAFRRSMIGLKLLFGLYVSFVVVFWLVLFTIMSMKNKANKRSVMEVDKNSFVIPPID